MWSGTKWNLYLGPISHLRDDVPAIRAPIQFLSDTLSVTFGGSAKPYLHNAAASRRRHPVARE
jgi:hypothetical protein